jgi:hypothetical protein
MAAFSSSNPSRSIPSPLLQFRTGGGALWASYATAGAVVGLGLLSLAAEACGAGADSKEAPRRPGGRSGRGASAGAGSDHAASLVDSAAEVELVDGEALYSGLLDEDDG